MRKFKRFIRYLIIATIISILVATPVFAIAYPDNQVEFGTGGTPLFAVFEDVLETGDMLFVAEVFTDYAVIPTDYTAAQAFILDILDPTGTTTLSSTHLNEYGDRPVSIYLTAAQVTALGLTSGVAYGLRIDGNPLITFVGGVPGNQTRTRYLSPTDYIDQSGATDDNNPLRDFIVLMAHNMEANDTPPAGSEYLIVIQGVHYLTTVGGSLFLEGINGLSTMCPILFQSALETMSNPAPDSTGAYATSVSANNTWGQVAANGLTNLGVYLGMSQSVAGMAMLLIFAVGLGGYIFMRTQSTASVLLIVAVTPLAGSFLGLMNMALAFIIMITITILLSWYFFAKGSL